MAWVFLFLLLSRSVFGATPLEESMAAAMASTPAARRACWGVRVVNVATGAVIFRHNDERLFVPASNVKLFSSALALVRLGPEHRFETLVTAPQAPDAEGRIRGDLRFMGGGDPTLTGRETPYRKDAARGDRLRVVEELAAAIAAKGVRRVDGDVVGDDTAFLWEPYPDGWSQDDTVWEYGAPVSALSVGDNAQTLTVRPGTNPLDPGRIFLSPPLEYYVVDNRVVTTATGEETVEVRRTPGSRVLRVRGTLPLGASGRSFLVAVDDPALFAAAALHDALTRRGIAIRGQAVAIHRNGHTVPPADPAQQVELARRSSPPLAECLQVLNKVSQNLHAELMLRAAARRDGGAGSLKAGLEELKAFLQQAGIPSGDYSFADGSGLSRLNLASPAAVTALLRHMAGSEHSEPWLSLFPVGGEDGTLSERFRAVRRADRIRAKTGSLEHVGALSGYAEPRPGERLAFSILVNNFNGPSSELRAVIDKMGAALLQ